MCLISFYPKNVQPDVQALLAGAAVNKDGCGFAVWKKPGVYSFTHSAGGSDAANRRVIGLFARTRAKYPNGPAVFHSRWATAGPVTFDNCQPLCVPSAEGVDMAFAHNGTLPDVDGSGERSDTRVFAEDVLPKLVAEFGTPGPDNRDWLDVYFALRPGNRAVLLLPDGNALRFGDGYWSGGAWYSNTDYIAPLVVSRQDALRRVRLLYRDLGDKQRGGDESAGRLRAALLAMAPDITKGSVR